MAHLCEILCAIIQQTNDCNDNRLVSVKDHDQSSRLCNRPNSNQPFVERPTYRLIEPGTKKGPRGSPPGLTATSYSRSFNSRRDHPTANNQAIPLPIALRTFTALKKSCRFTMLAGSRQFIVHSKTYFFSVARELFFGTSRGGYQADITPVAPLFAPVRSKPRSTANCVPQDGHCSR